MRKSIILMSGGLDSLTALAYTKEEYDIELALTFDYGQKSAESEIDASKKICKYYNISHKVIELDWLKMITKTALVSGEKVSEEDFGTIKSAKQVWVPNRNGLFLNIAACFADSFDYDYIIYGANKDEGKTFPDNTEAFRTELTKVFEKSTLKKPKIIAPLINYSKNDIVRIAIERSAPLEFVRSCYTKNGKNCGKCESCLHLRRAIEANNCTEYIDILFDK